MSDEKENTEADTPYNAAIRFGNQPQFNYPNQLQYEMIPASFRTGCRWMEAHVLCIVDNILFEQPGISGEELQKLLIKRLDK